MHQSEQTSVVMDESANPQIHGLLDYLEILARRWRLIISVPLVASVITAVISLFMPNIYTATTMIIPTDDNAGGMGSAIMAQLGGLAAMAGGALGGKTNGELYVTMLKSEAIKDPVIDKFNLMNRFKLKFRADAYKVLDNKVDVSLGKKDGVLTIQVNDKSPKMAADLANAYVSELGKLAAGIQTRKASDNKLFFQKQIEYTKSNLNKSEEALKEFQSKNKSFSVPDQAKASIENVAQLRAQLAIREVELGTLQRQFTDNSQEVKSAKAAVAQLRGQITGLEGKNGSSSSIPQLGKVPQLGQEYLRLMREFKIQEAMLEMLVKQHEIAGLSENKDMSPFGVLQKANVPDKKTKPIRRNMVLKAFFVSFFTCSFFVLYSDRLRHIYSQIRNRVFKTE